MNFRFQHISSFLLVGLVSVMLPPASALAGGGTATTSKQELEPVVSDPAAPAAEVADPTHLTPPTVEEFKLVPDPGHTNGQQMTLLDLKPSMFPYNMARARMGTKIRVFGTEPTPVYSIDLTGQKVDENLSEHGLLSDDMTVGYPLKEENISLMFSLPYAVSMNSFNFFNFGGAGTAILYGADKSPSRDGSGNWKQLGAAIDFDAPGVYQLHFDPKDLRYFKAEFIRKRDGRVGAFGLFGDLHPGRINQVTTFRSPKDDVPLHRIINNNLASVYNGAQVVYVSSGEGDSRNSAATELKIDDDASTYYEFTPDDKTPTGIIDLGDTRPLKRVSWLFQSVAGRFDIYLSNRLPESFTTEKSPRGDIRVTGLTEQFFRENPPFHSVRINDTREGRLCFNFQDTRARYVVFRFTPDVATASLAPVSTLRLHSFHVFGNYDPMGEAPPEVVETENFPDLQPRVLSP